MFPALAFLNPWLLLGLATLPLIYLLLRTVPPRPRQIEFPPTRILVDIENKEKTPARTPWWLLLIRLLAAALVILALAEPILNPGKGAELTGKGPVVVLIDNGWSAGSDWSARASLATQIVDEAERQNRAVVIVGTAAATKAPAARIEAPSDARSTLAAVIPMPFAPDRKVTLDAVSSTLASAGDAAKSASVVWITDGIDHGGEAGPAADAMAKIADSGSFTVITMKPGTEALGVIASVAIDGKLAATVLRAGGAARAGIVHALSAKGERLGEAEFTLGAGAQRADLRIEMPLELRNQVTRIEIAGERSAGAVNLLDQRSQWQRIGLISGEAQEQAQPLLAQLYYVQKAVQPFAEIIRPNEKNLTLGIDKVIDENASVLILADVGTLDGAVAERVSQWVEKGGVLVRFAGPRLEKGGDELLPVPLRVGGRTLGGALSWSTPQPLAAMEDQSIFAGLAIPPDVAVRRQVLADPAMLTPEVKIWARLMDGTPLVTAKKLGEGQLVLFHVTANSDWSNLPISGLFVEMMKRVSQLGTLTSAPPNDGTSEDGAVVSTAEPQGAADAETLPPVATLDGQGALKPPPPTAQPIALSEADKVTASLDHPPGYYGGGGAPRAINVITPGLSLAPLPALPASAKYAGSGSEDAEPLKPWLLTAAVALVFADILAMLALMGAFALAKSATRTAALAVAVSIAALGIVSDRATAQGIDPEGGFGIPGLDIPGPQPRFIFPGRETEEPKPPVVPGKVEPADEPSIRATSKVTFGYVTTGTPEIDDVSRAGLEGLVRVLKQRTAVEPGKPIAVDIVKDEIAFFPVLYWPVPDNPEPLPDATLAKIDAYLKQGGMIIFDTRDYGQGVPTGMAMAGSRGPALQKLIGRLDLPRLEPVPENHVLTRSFYLLQSFPGRWDGGDLWVEAQEPEASESGDGGERRARQADGVTAILITPNDLASAWATDPQGRPLYAVVPGGERQREYAMRAGVNIVMHALTGNYKADQVHVPALLERLGQ
ncbi:MAG: DUF4159 domain-containing protein [Hyphomicrobium sp.]|nr:DUF4159 domain-containing protein [Hyphomicrobium sp.]